MAKRFILAFVSFVAVIVPFTFAAALLAAPARPAPLERPGCDRNLADANASMAAMQARMQRLAALPGSAACTAARLYFLELVKTRAVAAVCISGPDRARELGRLDADVERVNHAIAATCR